MSRRDLLPGNRWCPGCRGPGARPVRRNRPGLAGAELIAWTPLVLLALAVGLVPALVLSYAAGPVAALLGVVTR